MGSRQETIALHFCARPRGNRKLRYLLRDYLPPFLPFPLAPLLHPHLPPPPPLYHPPLVPLSRPSPLIRGGNRPLSFHFSSPYPLPQAGRGAFSLSLSPGDVEVWRPRMQPAPRAEGAGVGVRLAKRVGQTERSIARTCFRHLRILPSTYNRPISVGACNTVGCVCITHICIYV